MPFSRPLPIATRTSPLALAQAHDVQRRLAKAHGASDPEQAFPILGLTTTGDRITDRALLAAGGKGLFTKELERALLSREAAFAVHSMKDVPTRLPEGLTIAAILEREDPRDVLLIADGSTTPDRLPDGAVLGTASIRRQAQALNARPDLKPQLLRGNVDTRLAAVKNGAVHATFLARAGLKRLARPEAALTPVPIEIMLPACAQGAVGVEIGADDEEARAALAPLNHGPSALAVAAERALLEALDGSCRTPIADHAVLQGDRLMLHGEALTPDGRRRWAAQGETVLNGQDPAASAAALGRGLGEEIRAAGGEALRQVIAETG